MNSKLLALIFFAFCSQLYAAELQILTVDEPPSSYVDEAGQVNGFAVDIVKAIQEELSDRTPITVMPEIRVLKTASESPNVLLFGFSKTPDREDKYHMITLLLRKPWVLYARDSFDQTLKNIDDAKSAGSIGVVRGDVRSIYLDKLGFVNTQKVPYHELNVRMLMSNRVDMIFYEPLGLAYIMDDLGFSLAGVKEVLRPESSEVYLMMSKPGTDLELVKQWQDAAEKLKQEGKFKRIADKWSSIISKQTGVKSEATARALNF